MNDISYSKFINGLTKAGVTVNRKMLAEIAIDNPKSFASLVAIAKDALEGKKFEETKAPKTVKKEEKPAKKEKKEEATDYSKMTVAELRKIAKEKGVEGTSTMKKAELLDALK